MNIWNSIIIDPLVNALLFIYGALGNNYALAIVLLTVIVRLVTFPLTQRQLRSAANMQKLQPELEDLRKKHEKDKEALASKQMELYKEHGVSPLGGCLPTLIQFPLLIGFYQAISFSLAASPLQLLNLSRHVYSSLPNLNNLVPLNSSFLWMDLSRPDPLFILPVLVVVTSFLQQKLTTTPNANPQQAGMARQMQFTMPLLIGYFALTFPSGLSVYYATSNILGIVQGAATGQVKLVNKLLGREETDERQKARDRSAARAKAKAKRLKRSGNGKK